MLLQSSEAINAFNSSCITPALCLRLLDIEYATEKRLELLHNLIYARLGFRQQDNSTITSLTLRSSDAVWQVDCLYNNIQILVD